MAEKRPLMAPESPCLQGPAKTRWLEGVLTLQQGDGQLSRAAAISGVPVSTTARREIAAAFATLGRASAQIIQVDAMLGIRERTPTITLPTKITGFLGTGLPGTAFPVTLNPT